MSNFIFLLSMIVVGAVGAIFGWREAHYKISNTLKNDGVFSHDGEAFIVTKDMGSGLYD